MIRPAMATIDAEPRMVMLFESLFGMICGRLDCWVCATRSPFSSVCMTIGSACDR